MSRNAFGLLFMSSKCNSCDTNEMKVQRVEANGEAEHYVWNNHQDYSSGHATIVILSS